MTKIILTLKKNQPNFGQKYNFVFVDNGKCFGGIARLKKSVDEITNSHENVIFLNGGDFYQGNIWFSLFKWEIVAKFAELLNFTAMVIYLLVFFN